MPTTTEQPQLERNTLAGTWRLSRQCVLILPAKYIFASITKKPVKGKI